MTIQLWCLLIGVVLPYIWAGASLPFRSKQFGKPDLREPRVQGDKLEGGGARAVGAQMNAWEALAVFSVANLSAFMAGVDPSGNWSLAAMIWVVARILHGGFYIGDIAPARVLSFVTGLAMSLWIIAMALNA